MTFPGVCIVEESGCREYESASTVAAIRTNKSSAHLMIKMQVVCYLKLIIAIIKSELVFLILKEDIWIQELCFVLQCCLRVALCCFSALPQLPAEFTMFLQSAWLLFLIQSRQRRKSWKMLIVQVCWKRLLVLTKQATCNLNARSKHCPLWL